jgi:hypothetical protein
MGVQDTAVIRNEDIINELGIEPIKDKLSNYSENWKTHLERMTEERIPRYSRLST